MEHPRATGVPLLELIPRRQFSREQKTFSTVSEGDIPIYRFTREPTSLDDFDWDNYPDNKTIIVCASKRGLGRFREKHVYFNIDHVGNIQHLQCVIFSKSDAAVAETATFFWSLKHSGDTSLHPEAALWIDDVYEFDFAPFQPEQLARILDSNPKRFFAFRTGTWNAKQTAILASRPFPLKMRLSLSPLDWGSFAFTDGGKTFVDALQKRQSSFGSLIMVFHSDFVPHCMPFSPGNLKRLFQLEDVFDNLEVCCLDKQSVLLPFSAKVKVLEYNMNSEYIQPEDLASVHITTKDISVKMCLDKHAEKWGKLPMGHFERLTLSMKSYRRKPTPDDVAPVARALIRAIRSNPQLTYLNLSSDRFDRSWTPHLQNIFKSMEDHTGLRTVVVDVELSEKSIIFSGLKQLLSRNPNVVVCDSYDKEWMSR